MSTQKTVTTETKTEEAPSLLDDVIHATSVKPTVMRHPAAAMPPDEVWKLATSAAASKMFPGTKDVDQAMVLMQLCQADGLHPIDALRRYHVIQGRPSMRADAMLAEFQARGGRVRWNVRTDDEVSATFAHPIGGEATINWDRKTADDRKISFDWDKDAGRWKPKHNWTTYPRQMLTARVISEGVRLILPGVVVGVYTPEEVEDFDDAPQPPQRETRPPAEPAGQKPEPAGNRRSPGDIFKAALKRHGEAGGWLDEHGKPVKTKMDTLKAYAAGRHHSEYEQARECAKLLAEGWGGLQDRLKTEQEIAETERARIKAQADAAGKAPPKDEPEPAGDEEPPFGDFGFGDDGEG